MLAIKPIGNGQYEVLAKDTRPALTVRIRAERERGNWRFPVQLVENNAKLISDQDYFATLISDDKNEFTETMEARLNRFMVAFQAGNETLKLIAEATGLTVNQVELIDKRYHPRKPQKWVANMYDGTGEPVETVSEYFMAKAIGVPVKTVKQVAASDGIALGYCIKRVS